MKGLHFKAKAEYSEPNVVHSLAAVRDIFSSLIVFHTDFLSAIAVADRPPCLSPFIATRAFPSGLLGPVLFVHGCLRLMAIWSERNPLVSAGTISVLMAAWSGALLVWLPYFGVTSWFWMFWTSWFPATFACPMETVVLAARGLRYSSSARISRTKVERAPSITR
jgi:hypothetical protein